MDISFIYNECKSRLSEYKGTWIYDDFFKDSLGRRYFEDSVRGDKYVNPEVMSDDEIVDHIVYELNKNKTLNDIEQLMIG
jgi:hypothetical protein